MSIAVVTPMQEEMEAVRDALRHRGFESRAEAVGRLPVDLFPELDLALAVGGTGKSQFGVQAQHLLDARANTELLVCAGAAGALGDGLSVGDVVVGTRTIEHDYVNRFSKRPLPSFDADAESVESLRKLPSPDGYGITFGYVASGDEDVVDSVRRNEIRTLTDALVVAWEGAGGARACQFSDVPYVEVRGVTDGAGPSAPEDFARNLRLAMGNVADLMARWLTSKTE